MDTSSDDDSETSDSDSDYNMEAEIIDKKDKKRNDFEEVPQESSSEFHIIYFQDIYTITIEVMSNTCYSFQSVSCQWVVDR